ncbi:MAG: CDP-diglyceride synthetase [Moraxellaceae bacterium]|nr:MAG: CDP-diglyceride synthetase [Moraxellaceae bacterium]
MSSVGELIYLVLPVIIGGVLNMVFVKASFLDNLKTPMDHGRLLKDGKRLFGENKTWKGFWGMIVLTSLSMLLLQAMAMVFDWANELSLFPFRSWSFPVDGLLYGAVWGFAYVLAELPNSYIKRRIDIAPGTNSSGFKGKVFILVDQADSVIGCVLFMPLFFTPTLIDAIAVLFLATALHLMINFLLYLVGLKSQPA